ncbi:spore coat protein [Halalkalibacter alkaliphilus]|uniref:Spore coat protein n=1 Tax=Halalkalibacter alkaliphilus TaxID=2917993 RepID=A0A9X2CS18_9BACI|nr:spore coat protein [Halalkalibacter alkaliphilus]MCL7747161.1 spore coat protein [Halalkalibacter alkaliphilus]
MNQDVYYSSKKEDTPRWSALDSKACHPMDDSDIKQSAGQVDKTFQQSEEYIIIKDSCDVNVSSTDTKAAVSLQASLQAAIALVISISIASSEQAEQITQELLQSTKTKQMTFQKTVIENSRNVDVTTTDTQIGVNIQLLLQILLALLVNLDVL